VFVSDEPSILHADVDAFYASVAQRDDPRLLGRPVLVGSWVVMAASYEARARGVRGGMSTVRARRLCPGAIVADPSWSAYVEASRVVFEIFRRFTPVVEPASMEEAFLDVSRAGAPAAEIAVRLRRAVREEAGLPLSVGVARTKVVAKIASRSAKPDGLFVVPAGGELAFLHPLPVERIWGVGPATARRLHTRGVLTVGQAAALSEADLMAILGKAAGRYVHAIAHDAELRPVRRRRGRRSFGAQRALGRAPRSRGDLDAALEGLAERVTHRMQRKGRAGRTVVLRLRFSDYARATRSCTLGFATAEAAPIAAASRALLDGAMPLVERRGITLIGLTVTNLDGPGADQLTLPVFEAIEAAAGDAAVAAPPMPQADRGSP
jgi:DNA polymerase-4